MNKWISFCLFVMAMAISSDCLAGTGTLTVTFEYKDNKGVEQPLTDAYVYLHDESKKPHVNGMFNKPSYILGPSDSSGRINATVPEGRYYIRITKRRNPQSGNANKFGPPEPMDYTWSQTNTITIRTNATTDLGIKYAGLFTAPITITGTVTSTTGDPAEGLYVSAQTEPCYADGDNGDESQCGPVKILARKRTDADGQYTLALRDPGTYYVYVGTCLSGEVVPSGARSCVHDFGGTLTVQLGETQTLNIVTSSKILTSNTVWKGEVSVSEDVLIPDGVTSDRLAGTGTLTVTFEYKDSKGVEQPLTDAYVYLHDESKKPVNGMFNKPSYILGPSDSSGRINATVPEGRYYIRITKRRNPQSGKANKYGPPKPMDYTWSQTNTITIRTNATTDLGIKYAGFFTAP